MALSNLLQLLLEKAEAEFLLSFPRIHVRIRILLPTIPHGVYSKGLVGESPPTNFHSFKWNVVQGAGDKGQRQEEGPAYYVAAHQRKPEGKISCTF